MVDVTDAAYRVICRRAGAAMTYTEMIYVDAILHENASTLQKMKIAPREGILGLQITGNSEKEFERLVREKKDFLKKYDLIDINCGCPSLRITGSEAGSFLLKNPEKIAAMIKILKKAGLIVTAKIRLGFHENNVLEVARAIERAGADAITVHARLAVDGGSVPADWKEIARVKKNVKIPVIGNGDVVDGKTAEELLKLCDGVMIARAAIGDPFIFERILYFLDTDKRKNTRANSSGGALIDGKNSARSGNSASDIEMDFDVKKNLRAFKEYLKLAERYGVVDMGRVKYLGGKFLRGFNGASRRREEFMKLKTFEDVKMFANDFKRKF